MSGAYIDLKNAHVFLEDGYVKVGAVNNASGYAIGATALAVDGFTGILDSGIPVKITGDATIYTLVSHTETSTNTTGIVITPALVASVLDNAVITFGPHRLEIKIGEGNCTYDEKNPREYKKNRGLLDQVRDGEQEPMDVNLAFAWLYLSSNSSDTVPTVEEVFYRSGPSSAWVTTGIDCEPYAVDIVIVNEVPTCGSESQPWEVIRLGKFRYESLAHDPKAGTVTVTGKCNDRRAVKTRVAVNGY